MRQEVKKQSQQCCFSGRNLQDFLALSKDDFLFD